ncbi:MAG: hypothetical protein IPP27_11400 [Bacteroidetes bacterium]|nr:hypothetical protein [Bacteroidota bacterium]
MKLILLFSLSFILGNNLSFGNVYLITYFTYSGHTGHSGIAIDKYDFIIRDTIIDEKVTSVLDTVQSEGIVYYDFWPKVDHFDLYKITHYIDGEVFKINSFRNKELTLNDIAFYGIPHKKGRPCDAIVSMKTTYEDDMAILKYLDSLVSAVPQFHGIKNNCSDFVRNSFERILNKKVNAFEKLLFIKFTTPNELYSVIVRQQENSRILKFPKVPENGKFLTERILHRYLVKFKILNPHKNQIL